MPSGEAAKEICRGTEEAEPLVRLISQEQREEFGREGRLRDEEGDVNEDAPQDEYSGHTVFVYGIREHWAV